MNISTAQKMYFNTREADGYSSNTLDMYRWALRLLQDRLGDKEVSQVSEVDIREFFSWIRTDYVPTRPGGSTKPLAGRSLENIWTATHSFFNFLREEGLVSGKPDHSVRRPVYTPRAIQPFTEEETRKLLKACEYTRPTVSKKRKAFTMRRSTALRDVALVLVLLDTGLRVSEVARLNVENVDLETGEVEVEPFGTGRKTKGRIVHIGKGTRKAVWRYLARRDELFPEDPVFLTIGERRMDRSSIRLMLNKLGDRAGVPNCHPHRFRHTFSIQFLRNGGSVFDLQKLLGHSTLEMVQRYLSLSQADTKQAHRVASPVDRWRL